MAWPPCCGREYERDRGEDETEGNVAGSVEAVPMLIHPMKVVAAAGRQPVVLTRRAFLRLLYIRLDETTVTQSSPAAAETPDSARQRSLPAHRTGFQRA